MFMFLPTAHGAEMVNVEYIHQYLNTRWGIDLPYNPELENPRVAANMKYLLTVIDIANEFLNNEQTTDYGNGEYATLAAADTIATNTAIDTLINAPTFTITTTPNTSSFSMIIGAAGNFIIDWGDGKRDVIADKPVGATTYTHSYSSSGEYEINLTGRATDYSDAAIDPDTAAGLVPTFTLTDIFGKTFYAPNVAKISGGLGRVFPTMDDGSNPNFAYAFALAPITEIPADLFDGIHGAPAMVMFAATFMGTQITEVPAYIFGELNGDGAMGMFSGTFSNCANLTTIDGPLFSGTITPAEGMFSGTFSNTALTEIPANLFGTLNGDGAPSMFKRTFYNCKKLTTADGPLFSGTITPADSMFDRTFFNSTLTEIPANLFGTLNGDGAPSMFYQTFAYCENLTTVDRPLFSGTITPAEGMFNSTFANSAITEIPADLFAGIQGAPAERMFNSTFNKCANLQSIPSDLFAGIRGAPAEGMFYRTFSGSAITNIPANLFGTLNGNGAPSMFELTFYGCKNLTTADGPLFSGTITPAERMFADTFSGSAITNIPANLFGTLNGDGAPMMFSQTFAYCENLITADGPLFSGTITPAERMFADTFYDTAITNIPADLFAGIRGAPAERMFYNTFYACSELQSIPENLFAGISGPAASNMFWQTFANCSSLTGPSARTNGQYLYEIWPDITGDMNTYYFTTGLSDYDQIPSNWK